MFVPQILKTISKIIIRNNGSAVIVGGAVRDCFLKLPMKDYDIEVYGLTSMEVLEEILLRFGSVNLVGKSFGILKFVHENEAYDFSFPRLESKVSKGHRGFDVHVDGNIDFRTASKRRDFTVNAMGYDIEKKCFLDPFNGQGDIKKQILRHIDDNSFVEDPLRVYRAVQFCARFDFELADETESLCKRMVEEGQLSELPKERVYQEFQKLLLKAPKPSIGFELMRALGVISFFPELEALIGVPQDPNWHPEGDVWVHTMLCVDEMASIMKNCSVGIPAHDRGQECPRYEIDEKRQLKMMFAILCHDFGKPATTTIEADGRIRAIGHEKAGLAPTESFMYRLTDEHDFIASLLPLVEHHLKPLQFYAHGAKAAAIRRLATKVNIEELVLVAKADFLGRTTDEALHGKYEAGDWLLEKARALHVQEKPLENLLQGKDLVNLGLKPSPLFRKILDEVYDLQLEGTFHNKEEALRYVHKHYTDKAL